MTYSLKLDFRSGDKTKGQLPGTMMQVTLKAWGRDDEGGPPIVSHQCVGPTEWKFEMQRLRDELDVIEAEGLRRFHHYHKELQNR